MNKDIKKLFFTVLLCMGIVGGVAYAASFYPFSGGLSTGTGGLKTLTGTADKDAGIAMFNADATYGNAFMPFTLDVDGSAAGDTPPYIIIAGDGGNENWELCDIYGMNHYAYGTLPEFRLNDTDGAGTSLLDKHAGSLKANFTTVTEDAEVSDIYLTAYLAGTETNAIYFAGATGLTTLYKSLALGVASPDEALPAFTIRADADSDAADTTEVFTLVLTPNANPVLATWGFTSTQSAGYTFDKPVSLGTSNAFTTGTIELGAATDTTLSRSAAGVLAVENVDLVKITSTQVLNFGGATLEIPNAADPDLTVTGQISMDTDAANVANDVSIRGFDGTNQFLVARKLKTIHATAIKPQDWADAARDKFVIWENTSGMTFTVVSWSAKSGTDDTTLAIMEADADGQNPTTVDAVEIATNGTGLYYASDTTITAPTIETGHIIYLDFDDTDDPAWVKISITGWFDANVD